MKTLIRALAIITLSVPSFGADVVKPTQIVKPIYDHSFEGSVKVGKDYQHKLENGLIFSLSGTGPWTLKMHFESKPEFDLIYPLNPPYRFSNHLNIGEGYSVSAKESVKNSPRNFSFIYRVKDVKGADEALNKILWPGNVENTVEKESQFLSGLPYGNGQFEIVTATFSKLNKGEDKAENETINAFSFKVHLTWPKN